MPPHPTQPLRNRETRLRERTQIAPSKPCPSKHAHVRSSETPTPKLGVRAIAVLWLLTTPRPTEFSLKSFRWELIAQLKYEDVATELARIGLLERVPVRSDSTTTTWTHAYRLAPAEQPLNQTHSAIIRQMTDCMLKYWDDEMVSEVRAVPELISKLLGGIRHRRPGLRDEYNRRFVMRS